MFVEPTHIQDHAKWDPLPDGASFEIARDIRDILLGAIPSGVTLTRRAVAAFDGQRVHRSDQVTDGALVIMRDDRNDRRWWTWAGSKASRTSRRGLAWFRRDNGSGLDGCACTST